MKTGIHPFVIEEEVRALIHQEESERNALLDKALGHIAQVRAGQDVDPGTGLAHLAHARACLGLYLQMT
jgi:hypothetical protein